MLGRSLLLASFLVMAVTRSASALEYALVTSWSVSGDGGIAVDAAGDVYVAHGTEVSKYDPTGAPLAGGFDAGTTLSRIAIASDGSFYLLATSLAILHFDAAGVSQSTWPGIASNSRGLAVDANHNVYVFVFEEGEQIKRVASDGTPQNAFGAFEISQAIAVGPDGSIYGTDGSPHTFAVQRFPAEGGDRITGWGDGFAPIEDGPSADGDFHTPAALSIAGGKVFVADGGNSRIQVFTESGTFLTKWSTTSVRGVAADTNGNVYVYGNGKVEKWAPSSDTPVAPATWGAVKARWSH